MTKLIINAVTSGELADIYVNDSITTRKSKRIFQGYGFRSWSYLAKTWTPTKDYYVDDPVTFEGKNYLATADNKGKNPKTSSNEWAETNQAKTQVYSPTEIYQCRLVEDVIFDKRRSRLYYDIFGAVLSAFDNNSGTFKPLGWFKIIRTSKNCFAIM